MISPHAPNLERAQESLAKQGFAKDRIWALQVAPVGCEQMTELLFDRPDRPDAVFLTDDNLVQPFLAGLETREAGGRQRRLRPCPLQLAEANWPC